MAVVVLDEGGDRSVQGGHVAAGVVVDALFLESAVEVFGNAVGLGFLPTKAKLGVKS